MDRFQTRRRLLATGTAALIASAGCIGDDGTGPADGADDDGSDEGTNGEDGGDAMDGDEDDVDGDGSDEGTDDDESDDGRDESPAWLTTTFEDVRTGSSFELASFDEPVLVHLFAIWCSKCDRQEARIADLREDREDFEMVSLNVDPNEDGEAIRDHAESNGYDWRWAVVPPEITDRLVDEFGSDVVNPPTVPKLVICPDGEPVRIEDGVVPPEDLGDAIDGTC